MYDHWISYHCWYWFWSQFARSQFAWSLDFLPFMILIRKMSDYIISLPNTDTKKRSYCWSKNCQKRWVLRPVLKAEKGCGSCEHEGELVTWHFCQSTMSSNVDQGKTQFIITKQKNHFKVLSNLSLIYCCNIEYYDTCHLIILIFIVLCLKTV